MLNFVQYAITITSPLGKLLIRGSQSAINTISFTDDSELPLTDMTADVDETPALFHETVRQLNAYFAQSLRVFDLPLQAIGTDFQQRVWHELQRVEYGKTASYGYIAEQLGDTKVVRAVGMANGSNPIAIVIPCHRIIGSNGSLTGYAGGLWRKQWLLQHESRELLLF